MLEEKETYVLYLIGVNSKQDKSLTFFLLDNLEQADIYIKEFQKTYNNVIYNIRRVIYD